MDVEISGTNIDEDKQDWDDLAINDCDPDISIENVTANHKSVVYIEARLALEFQGDPKVTHNSLQDLFAEGKICYMDIETELTELETNQQIFPEGLESVKVIEYVKHGGSDHLVFHVPATTTYCVNVYKLQGNIEIDPMLPGTLTLMPSTRHEGIWERLVFDDNTKENILWVLINMFKFSCRRGFNIHRRMNPLILFTGLPGTGKTSLALAVIQKLSIRMNMHYDQTRLLHVIAAPLISKFFGETAQKISDMFNTIHLMCVAHPRHFLCVLIDEVESLVSSRKAADEKKEIQDTIRATNTLLTGIDMVRYLPNLIILCTSNLVTTLDEAFLDRVGRHITMENPSLAGRYQILHDGISDMISMGVIEKAEHLPNFRYAQYELLSRPEKPGSVLVRLAERLAESSASGRMRSARNLGQLVEVALADRLRTDSCSLGEALKHVVDFVDIEDRLGKKLESCSGILIED